MLAEPNWSFLIMRCFLLWNEQGSITLAAKMADHSFWVNEISESDKKEISSASLGLNFAKSLIFMPKLWTAKKNSDKKTKRKQKFAKRWNTKCQDFCIELKSPVFTFLHAGLQPISPPWWSLIKGMLHELADKHSKIASKYSRGD